MKKLTLSFLFVFSILLAVAQIQNDEHLYCYHAQAAANYLKSSQEIIQTPLLNDYDVKHYFLDIEVSNLSVDVSGEVTILSEVTATELDTFAFELLDEMAIYGVYINGEELSVVRENDECFIPLNTPLSQGELFTAKIEYGGTPPTGGFFAGVTNTYDSWGKWVTWTLSEPFAARDWWPTKQVLTDKADSAWIFLTTASTNMAGSNGLLTAITPMPDNKLRYEWKTNYPIDYYLISFAVSEYQEYNLFAHPEGTTDSVLIQNFIYDVPGCLENYQDQIDQTAEFIELFSDLFAMYPFAEEKYGHCLTDLGGGMEHQTMTTIGGFSFGLVAHELAHMWFGDNITCATWSDIWINEGFATYGDYLAVENIQGASAANQKMNGIHNSVMSAPGGSIYVPEDEVTYDNIWRIFDSRLSYNKGAAFLHIIRGELQNDDLFFEVMHTYSELFSDSTATGLDFMNVLNQVTGEDFTDIFNEWYFGEGYPTYSLTWSQDDNATYVELSQTTSMPSVTPWFSNKVGVKFLYYGGGDTIVYLKPDGVVSDFILPITNQIGLVQIDPENWIVNQTGSITTGTKNIREAQSVKLYPNPVSDILTIEADLPEGSNGYLKIYNNAGKEIWTSPVSARTTHINLSDWAPGNYSLGLINSNKKIFRNFIISR